MPALPAVPLAWMQAGAGVVICAVVVFPGGGYGRSAAASGRAGRGKERPRWGKPRGNPGAVGKVLVRLTGPAVQRKACWPRVRVRLVREGRGQVTTR
jgi:hypothetical protein